jgi:hypothetical protein
MSRPEETVLKSESGLGLKQKGDKKYRFNPPAGTLILTDMRLIFAQSGGEFAKRLVAGQLFGGIIAGKLLGAMTKVKPEELDKALERPDSFQLNLQDLSEVKTERQFGGALLSVQWSAPDKPKALLYRSGVAGSLKGFDEWIKAIQDAKAH